MDITSLPQEMLANVLKYQDFATFHQLRKLRFKMNLIAKQYRIKNRVPVDKMEISGGYAGFRIRLTVGERVTVLLGLPYLYEPEYIYEEELDKDNLNEKFTEIGKKVTITNCLRIANNFFVDKTLLSALTNQRKLFKHCTSLTFYMTSVELSVEQNLKLLSIFPKLDEINIIIGENACTTLVNKKVLGNRKWSKVNVTLGCGDNPSINDDFLLEVATNCEIFMMMFTYENFTFGGVVNMIKKLVSQGWGQVWLGKVELGNVSHKDAEDILRSIDGVASVTNYRGSYEVQLASARDSFVVFVLDVPDN